MIYNRDQKSLLAPGEPQNYGCNTTIHGFHDDTMLFKLFTCSIDWFYFPTINPTQILISTKLPKQFQT